MYRKILQVGFPIAAAYYTSQHVLVFVFGGGGGGAYEGRRQVGLLSMFFKKKCLFKNPGT